MLSIPSSILTEMHKLHREGSLLCLCSVAKANIYIARNVRDVEWGGRTWTKSWFEVEGITQSGDEYAPSIQIHFSNIGGAVEQVIRDNDMLKRMWAELYVVNSSLIELYNYDYLYYAKYQIKKPIISRKLASVSAGLDNPLTLPWPSWKLHDSICQYPTFPGDERCPYSGALTTCNRTITDCITRHGHGKYFGGQLGILSAIQDDDGL
jgi:hypothetical protein